jgi:drug/metabolite transporter (DMT)-like permease
MKTLFLALSAPIIGTVGQLLLKHVMRHVGPIALAQVSSPWRIVQQLLFNPLFLLAVLLYVLGFVIWLIVLSKLDLSFAYPILAISYSVVPILSWWILGEQVSMLRWIGIVIICAGVTVVGLSR